ncbi:MAG: TonB-dependent receptor plug domain-containing protein, partial [Alistipes sp.]|nr:TonB-dependent receptor plug domain-containing protein [Alistipes sp.]
MTVVTLSLLVCCALFSPASVYAQGKGKMVTGKVTDARGPMIGVTISVKGLATRAALTDLDGNYSIDVAGVADPVLEFTYVGYQSQEVPVGARTQINVTMVESTQKIDEVVVTALGITRAEKSLGYAVSKVSGDDIASTVSGNWLDGMNGKVAGMSFESAATGPAGSVRVTLRGESSLSHDNNEALFVVDGVPLGNEKTASGGANDSDDAPIDYGNGVGDLNPDDIASVSVLKGPAATALYGSRAQNGAVIITTKSGSKQKGIGVSYSFSMVAEQASYWPELQEEYGAGSAALTTYATVAGKQYSPQEYFSFWSVYEGSTKVADRLWSRNMWGPKY